jgi:hypothetical protein
MLAASSTRNPVGYGSLQRNNAGQRRAFHGRHGAQSTNHLPRQFVALFRVRVDIGLGIVGYRQRHTPGDQVLRVETGIHLQKIPERPQENARADQKHQR